MVETCLLLLDTNPKFFRDQNRDCSRRNCPVYIGRVVSAMVSPGSTPRAPDPSHLPFPDRLRAAIYSVYLSDCTRAPGVSMHPVRAQPRDTLLPTPPVRAPHRGPSRLRCR